MYLRPTVPIIGNAETWFKYAKNIILDKNKETNLNLSKSTKRMFLTNRYFELYKRK